MDGKFLWIQMVVSDGNNNELGGPGARVGRGIPHRMVPIRSTWCNNIGCYSLGSDGNSGNQVGGANRINDLPISSTHNYLSYMLPEEIQERTLI